MNGTRNLSLSGHGAIELLIGMVTMLAPALFGFGPAGIVVSFAFGGLLVGLSLTLTARRSALAAWHRDFDSVYLIAAALAALGLALAGDTAAAVFFVTVVALQAAVNVATRYTTAF
jgi:hypothetical protein